MSEKKMSRIRKRADKKNKKGFAALKEAKSLRPKPEVKEQARQQTPGRAPKRAGMKPARKPMKQQGRDIIEIKKRRGDY